MARTLWPMVHQERLALGTDLEALGDEQWKQPSRCADWTIHDAVAHMTATHKMTTGKFIGGFIGAGFSFHKMSAKNVAAYEAMSSADLLREYTTSARRTTSAPGPKATWLGEAVIHAEDVRQPLGITRDYPADTLRGVLDYVVATQPLLGAKKRTARLKLVASDVEWSHGEGPEVRGPALSLIAAACGRRDGLANLTGDGVATLTART